MLDQGLNFKKLCIAVKFFKLNHISRLIIKYLLIELVSFSETSIVTACNCTCLVVILSFISHTFLPHIIDIYTNYR